MNPGEVDAFFHHYIRIGDNFFSLGSVPAFPVVDLVVLLAFLVRAKEGGILVQGLKRVHDGIHRLVVHFHSFCPVNCDVPVRGDHGTDLLCLVHNRIRWQYHLGIRKQGGHPVQVVLRQVLPCNDGQHPGNGQGLLLIDVFDLGIGVRTAHHDHGEHARQLHVIDIIPFAVQKTGIFLSLDRVTHTAYLC